jgi:hypothetical protein
MIDRGLLAVDDSPASLADQRLVAIGGTVLRYVAGPAGRAKTPIEAIRLDGEPAPAILEQARVWSADLIVIGRSGSPGPGKRPYVGSETRHVLEFADVPVLVVLHVDRRCRAHSGQRRIRSNRPVRSGGGAHRIDRTSRGRWARESNGLSH